MEHPSSESTDDEVLVLLREGKPLKELLEELISLRRWKSVQVKAQAQEANRMERMLTRLCVSLAVHARICTQVLTVCLSFAGKL